LEKVTVKGLGGVFLNLKVGFATILLMAITCVPSYIDVIGYAKANGRMTSPCTTVTEVNSISQSVLNESKKKAELEQPRSNSTANNAVDNSEQSDEWQTVQMRVTAYCPCPKCCGRYSDGETACGHKIRPGDAFVAADRKYPFGAEMVIAGYQNGQPVKVLDRGGAIRGNRLDVFFHTHEEALEWGVKHLDVKIHRN
jgi:3D (Asp-Asp-Asp) domain-containing protein